MPPSIQIPGLFYFLVDGQALNAEQLAPLLALLPPERIVTSSARNGEAYDSTRWPLARDAMLAGLAARRFRIPELDATVDALEAAFGQSDTLRAMARKASARAFAAMGADASAFISLRSDATAEDLAVFNESEPRWPIDLASLAEAVSFAYYLASDGLYAYHAHRGIPGPSAEPASRVVHEALKRGCLSVSELVNAAITLVDP